MPTIIGMEVIIISFNAFEISRLNSSNFFSMYGIVAFIYSAIAHSSGMRVSALNFTPTFTTRRPSVE